MTKLEGWGRFPRLPGVLATPSSPRGIVDLQNAGPGRIARGNGRAYGDAAIGELLTISTLAANRVKSFDPGSGFVTVEAGVLLADLIATFAPRGFFPPVVPGTKFVTVGGMVACDVHGKNHHGVGGFGDHVESLTLALPDGAIAACGPHLRPDLFWATVGGMGLTGTILDVTFRLAPIDTSWILQRTLVAENVADAIALLIETQDSTYSVAWIDCLATGSSLGRSVIFLGEHLSRSDRAAGVSNANAHAGAKPVRLSLPFDAPGFVLNRYTVGAFNALYYWAGRRAARSPRVVHLDPFFFPLDGIGRWNRLYGSRGFVQHQCVIPMDQARDALTDILTAVARFGDASFLAVLKKLRDGHGMLSFPMNGLTLALDLPMRGTETLAFLDRLDEIVLRAGGRLYLAKDARQKPAMLEAGYGRLGEWRALRASIGAPERLRSSLSNRLGLS